MATLTQKQNQAFEANSSQQLLQIKRQMRTLKNQMDLIEIISNFLPLPNIDARIGRLEGQMNQLNSAYQQLNPSTGTFIPHAVHKR